MYDQQKNDLENRLAEINGEMQRSDVLGDSTQIAKLSKENTKLRQVVYWIDNFTELEKQIKDNQEILDKNEDEELVALASEEILVLNKKFEEIKILLENYFDPKDPNNTKNAILEIRAGTGGDE